MTPDSARDTDARLEALEVKSAFSEDALDQLNDVVVRQQRQIDLLQQQVALLRLQQASAPEGAGSTSLRDEVPPHY
jgi:SlyX protein